jgi:hypothetical protein
MKTFTHMLNPGGLLFLGVPNGKDALYYNAHRIYGPTRFPKLIEDWQELAVFSGNVAREDIFKSECINGTNQPWWVLTPKSLVVSPNT